MDKNYSYFDLPQSLLGTNLFVLQDIIQKFDQLVLISFVNFFGKKFTYKYN